MIQYITNPAILGPLLVATVGAQQASQIQRNLALGNITLDNVYDIIENFAAPNALNFLKDLDKSNNLPPKKDDEDPKTPDNDPLDLLNLINTDRKKEDEKELTTISKGEETKESVSSDVESQTADRGSSVQQSDQGRETTVGGNLPLVKASQS